MTSHDTQRATHVTTSDNPIVTPGGFPLLIASDLDGTLLNPRERITPAVQEALQHARSRGSHIVIATGRPPRWLDPVLEQLDFIPLCVCANGALTIDPATGHVVASHLIPPDTMASIVSIARETLAGAGPVGFATERGVSISPGPFDEEFLVCPSWAYGMIPTAPIVTDLDEVISRPAVKLLVRCEGLSSHDICEALSARISSSTAHMTYSVNDGLVEIAAANVTKRTGVEDAAVSLGVEAADVVAFGDMPNDVEMLQWAGIGVAMGNAHPLVRAAADAVTLSNDRDGVAAFLSQWAGD